MKIYTPQISWHDRQPILSLNIQNRSYASEDSRQLYRLATGGNDSRVNIWKIVPSQTLDQKKPVETIQCLAELTQHQRSVNVVRFSPNLEDNFLASGDDDSLIFIWKLCDNENVQKTANSIDAGKSAQSKPENADNLLEEAISDEIWKPYKILRGHNQDVTDISWSKDGQNIVSGSVDNNVFVWDIHRGTKLHKVVKEHYSYVQGVAWDPLNRYIASLSADRNMLVFNVKSGKTVHRVYKVTYGEEEKKTSSKLFFDQTLMSFCRRLSFSPGGELLFAPSGIFETGGDDYKNTVYVFERNNLSRPSFYLPTNKFSVAVSCCPIVFELKPFSENVLKFPYRIVFAVATQDSVLFYDSQQLTPFAYVSQIHYLRLTDLSWSADGRFLMVTSTDGFTTFVMFDHEELGIPYTGKLLDLEVLEPAAVVVNTPAKKEKQSKAEGEKEKKEKVPKAPKTPKTPKTPKVSTPKVETPSSKNITTFFKKISPSSTPNGSSPMTVVNERCSTPKTATPLTISNKPNNQPAGRRLAFKTLFTASQKDENKNESVAQSENQYETGMKRKLTENDNESAQVIDVIEID